MKRIKKTISIVMAMIVLILATAVIAPVNARQKDISSTGGWPERITFDAGAAFKEDISWYVWTWSWDEEFEAGKWIRGKTEDCKTVYFSDHGPNVVFACMEGDVSDPDWDKVVLRSPEMKVKGYYYTVTGVDREKLDGEWSWDAPSDPTDPTDSEQPSDPTDPTDSEQPSDSITHEAFAILNPISTGTYYVNEEIEVQVGCAIYYYSYSANGSRMNTPNTVVLEFNKNNRVVHTSVIQFHADDLGYYLTDKFTPISGGTYIVRVGYSKSSVTSVSSSNYVGSYSFTVLSNEEPTDLPTAPPTDAPAVIIRGDVDGDEKVTIIDATAIQRHLASLPTAAYNEKAADVDGDNSVTIIDATCIQRHLANLPTQAIGIGEPIK